MNNSKIYCINRLEILNQKNLQLRDELIKLAE